MPRDGTIIFGDLAVSLQSAARVFLGEAAMNIRFVMLAVGCVVLSSCTHYQQGETAAKAEAEAQAQGRKDDAQCRSYGFQSESPDYVQCRMNIDNQRAATVQQQNPFSTGAHLYRH